jgi:hypothetical protein
MADLMTITRKQYENDMREAWREGHAAGRDYQGDGWNADRHDPECDNPYKQLTETKES